jgi:hypothetical protein
MRDCERRTVATLDLTGASRRWPADLVRTWGDCLAAAAARPDTHRTPPWYGVPAVRAMLASLLGHDADDVMVTVGVRAVVAAMALLGRRVIVEAPGYEGVRRTFEGCGVPRREPVPGRGAAPGVPGRPAPAVDHLARTQPGRLEPAGRRGGRAG